PGLIHPKNHLTRPANVTAPEPSLLSGSVSRCTTASMGLVIGRDAALRPQSDLTPDTTYGPSAHEPR
ncbi:similar to An04g00630, partial [Streptomyces azureus]